MVRFAVLGLACCAVLMAVALYSVSYRTRQAVHDLQQAEARLEELNREIATLKAERAFLSRPERIEPLARTLGMRPATGGQYRSYQAAGEVAR